MGKVYLNEQILTDIADATRSKTGSSAALMPGDMSDEIDKIEGIGDYFEDTINYVYHQKFHGWIKAIKKLPTFTFNGSSAQSLFNMCPTESIDLSKINVSNTTDMNSMFSLCRNLKSLDISGWDTSKVTNMRYMFQLCEQLDLNCLANLDTSNVTDMSYMFYQCSPRQTTTSNSNIVKLNWNTSKVTCMDYMFAYGENSDNSSAFDFSSWDFSKVTSMTSFFSNGYFPHITTVIWGTGIGTSLTNSNGLNLNQLQYLSKDTVLDLFNKIVDVGALGKSGGAVTIKLHRNVYDLLSSSDLEIATNKGWTVTRV